MRRHVPPEPDERDSSEQLRTAAGMSGDVARLNTLRHKGLTAHEQIRASGGAERVSQPAPNGLVSLGR
jgi:hypothetical protein